jgi:predicted signal transduction protein with EAL and GGDEF domain
MSWDHSHAAVLRAACADAVRLRQAALAPISVAVNLSARQFEMKDFAKRVGCILEAAALESQNLRLELTETMVMSNPDESRAILGELGAMGISLALDDFGTGYSSLRFLQQFPLHCLKIDRSFVSAVPADERSEAITRAVVALGKALHMRVVAEGVENHAQLDSERQPECRRNAARLYEVIKHVDRIRNDDGAAAVPDLLEEKTDTVRWSHIAFGYEHRVALLMAHMHMICGEAAVRPSSQSPQTSTQTR